MMRKLISFSLMAILLLSITACNEFKGYEQTDNGLYYKIIESSEAGEKPEKDDFLKVTIAYAFEDTVLYNSTNSPQPVFIRNTESQYQGDINEAFSLIKKGDSASFWTKADSFFMKTLQKKPLPPIAQGQDYIKIDMRLLGAFNMEEYKEEQIRMANEARDSEPENILKYIKDNNITTQPLESGLYFISKEEGEGETPKDGDHIYVHFDVKNVDGTIIYSSANKEEPYIYTYGTKFDVEGVLEGLGMMKKGGKAQVIFPSTIGFGEQGRGAAIPPFASLVYDLQLIDIKTKDAVLKEQKASKIQLELKNKQNKEEGVAFLKENKKSSGVVTLANGLQYKVLTEGKGVQPKAEDKVKVHYHGTLIDGTIFDSSVDKGKPASFYVNKVIKGWTEILQLMPVGSKWRVWIPEELGYGANPRKGGVIEPFHALVFDVELLEILPKQAPKNVKVGM